jgi:hypothetical protein
LIFVRSTREAPPPGIAPHALVGHQFAQYALAQSPLGHAQPLRGPYGAYRLQYRTSRQHQIGPVGSYARIGDTVLEIPAEQLCDHAIHAVAIHPKAVHAPPVVTGKVEMHARERGNRAGSSQQMKAGAFKHMIEPVPSIKGREHLGHVIDHGGKRFLRNDSSSESLGQ